MHGQIVTFTFPHIGNVGTNLDDIETVDVAAASGARGASSATSTEPANWRATRPRRLDEAPRRRRPAGVDTRALTTFDPREGHAARRHRPFRRRPLRPRGAASREARGLAGHGRPRPGQGRHHRAALRLGRDGLWSWPQGYGRQGERRSTRSWSSTTASSATSCALLTERGAQVTVVPATTTAEDILARKPDGVLLSNGPGDPAATGEYAVPEIRRADRQRRAGVRHLPRPPDAGAGARRATVKMDQGHHGANHPVKDLTTGKVEIVSMNHGFTVDRDSLPEPVSGDPRLAVRRHQLRHRAEGPPGLLRAAPPRSLARPAPTASTCSTASST